MIHVFSDQRGYYQVCEITSRGTIYGLWDTDISFDRAHTSSLHPQRSVEERCKAYLDADSSRPPLILLASSPTWESLVLNYPELFI